MKVDANMRGEAPAFLVNVEQQGCQLSQLRVVGGFDMTAIVAVIIVDAHTCCNSQTVEQLIGEVELSAIDVLLAFHLRVEGIGARQNVVASQQTGHQHIEHRDALLIFHEATTTHDTYHGAERPAVVLVGSKKSRHDGG